MNGETPFEEARRELERLFGYPPGAFDPASDLLRDVERINRVLGEGFTLLQDVIGPPQLRERIEALHPDQAILRIQKAAQDIMALPRKMWEIPPPWPDKQWRRD